VLWPASKFAMGVLVKRVSGSVLHGAVGAGGDKRLGAPRLGRDQYRFGYEIRRLTIGSLLSDKAASIGEREYLNYLPDGRRYTYKDMHLLSNTVGNGFLRIGIAKGEHVAMLMENCPEQLITYFALGKIGAVCVPINAKAKGQLLEYFLENSDSTVVIVEEALADQVIEIQERLPNLEKLVVIPAGQRLGNGHGAGRMEIVNFRDLQVGSELEPCVDVKFNDLAFIKYTSGTTGPSKGVMFSQARALLYAISTVEATGYRFDDICYIALPLYHANGLLGSAYAMLVSDARIVVQRRFSMSKFWGDICDSGATITNLLGSMANIVWTQPLSQKDVENNLRIVQIAPVPEFSLEFETRFGVRCTSGYGLTDYGVPVTYSIIDPVGKRGSAGRVRKGWQLKIVDEDDFECAVGDVGEIVLRSDFPWDASSGYYKMPEASLQALRNGWFHTGDRGYLDEDGFLWFVNRKKDSIRRRGENISSWEVEQVLLRHPAIRDAAVYAVRNEMADDEVAASIVLRENALLSEEGVVEYCAAKLPAYMSPRFVSFVDDLPRTGTEKVEKYKLQEAAEMDRGSLWDRDKAGTRLGS